MNASGTYGLAGSDTDRLAFLGEAYKMGEVFWDNGKTPSSLSRSS